jgi:nitronate monooxygenase
MELHTRLCDQLGITVPILNAPMGGGDAPGALAAAVSEAGGLGLIGGTTREGAPWLVEQIRVARDRTDRPFGVGFIGHVPGVDELVAVALDEGVRIIAHSFADPEPVVAAAHRAGALVLAQVRTVAAARRAAAVGADIVTAQGTEAGGHTGRVSTLPLVPAVVDAVAPRPVVAAGGIADGRGLAAALLLGAEGAWLGTAFLGTPEAGVSHAYRARVLDAGADDTVLTDVFDIATGMPWPDGVSGRAVRNRFADEWVGHEGALRTWADAHRAEYLAIDPEHAVDDHAVWAGEASTFVTRIEPAGEVVRRIAADAAAVLQARPAAVLGEAQEVTD